VVVLYSKRGNIWVGLTRGVTGHTLFDTLEVENPPANRNRTDGVRSQPIDKIAHTKGCGSLCHGWFLLLRDTLRPSSPVEQVKVGAQKREKLLGLPVSA